MSDYQTELSRFAARVMRALPAPISFAKVEYVRRKRQQAEKTAKIEREIAAIRAEAQQVAYRLYLVAKDETHNRQEDDLPLALLGDNSHE